MSKSIIVVGAGIAGLATAYSAAIRGFKVTVMDRDPIAKGASVRNFGMVWPIGQPKYDLFGTAIRSRNIWMQLCLEAGIWSEANGSLHMAYEADEWEVLQELEQEMSYTHCELLTPKQTMAKSKYVRMDGLKGALFSGSEMIIDPRQAIRKLPVFLKERYGVEFIWSKPVNTIGTGFVQSGKEVVKADLIFICNGSDFFTLYPEIFGSLAITNCKLQMMRVRLRDGGRIGPALCGPLSLLHYKSFMVARSLDKMRTRYEEEFSEYLKWGIHVMVSQTESGELTIGDSHEYGPQTEPFDKNFINEMILNYLGSFTQFPDIALTETWNGHYAKLTNGEAFLVREIEKDVMLFNGLGGAGMTLSFGLAERIFAHLS